LLGARPAKTRSARKKGLLSAKSGLLFGGVGVCYIASNLFQCDPRWIFENLQGATKIAYEGKLKIISSFSIFTG
jgi:hypothetical protein